MSLIDGLWIYYYFRELYKTFTKLKKILERFQILEIFQKLKVKVKKNFILNSAIYVNIVFRNCTFDKCCVNAALCTSRYMTFIAVKKSIDYHKITLYKIYFFIYHTDLKTFAYT